MLNHFCIREHGDGRQGLWKANIDCKKSLGDFQDSADLDLVLCAYFNVWELTNIDLLKYGKWLVAFSWHFNNILERIMLKKLGMLFFNDDDYAFVSCKCTGHILLGANMWLCINALVKGHSLDLHCLGLYLSYLLAVWSWVWYLAFLCFGFLICKRKKMVPVS